jgi:probable HAF family extracellular repeat protein
MEEGMNTRTNSFSRHAMLLAAIFTLTGAVPARLAADTYTSFDFPGATNTQAFGINEAGDIVGLYYTADGVRHGFLLSQGDFMSIDLSDVYTNAVSINDAGDIVGRYTDADNRNHGYLLRQGDVTTIDFPDAIFTAAAGITQADDLIVGRFTASDNITHGYQLCNDQFTSLDVPGSIETVAVRVNSDGDIVGYYESAGFVSHAFLLQNGSFTTIDPPGAVTTGDPTGLIGINDCGEIAGYYYDFRAAHGFLLSGGEFTTIDFPGARNTFCSAINNAGCIVGLYDDVHGARHGFILQRE